MKRGKLSRVNAGDWRSLCYWWVGQAMGVGGSTPLPRDPQVVLAHVRRLVAVRCTTPSASQCSCLSTAGGTPPLSLDGPESRQGQGVVPAWTVAYHRSRGAKRRCFARRQGRARRRRRRRHSTDGSAACGWAGAGPCLCGVPHGSPLNRRAASTTPLLADPHCTLLTLTATLLADLKGLKREGLK